jgi:F0F1-type ATP synthase membrane subunit b/b'
MGTPLDSPENDTILQHLLSLETEASALVDGAQAEADKRVADGENENRARYDSSYAAEIARLEAEYGENIQAVRADYQKQLDEYREGLGKRPVDKGAFTALAGSFFSRLHSGGPEPETE